VKGPKQSATAAAKEPAAASLSPRLTTRKAPAAHQSRRSVAMVFCCCYIASCHTQYSQEADPLVTTAAAKQPVAAGSARRKHCACACPASRKTLSCSTGSTPESVLQAATYYRSLADASAMHMQSSCLQAIQYAVPCKGRFAAVSATRSARTLHAVHKDAALHCLFWLQNATAVTTAP
jgi:hypothetical protein